MSRSPADERRRADTYENRGKEKPKTKTIIPYLTWLPYGSTVHVCKISDKTEKLFIATGAGTEEDRSVHQIAGGYWLMHETAYDDVEDEDCIPPDLEAICQTLKVNSVTHAFCVPNRMQPPSFYQDALIDSLPTNNM